MSVGDPPYCTCGQASNLQFACPIHTPMTYLVRPTPFPHVCPLCAGSGMMTVDPGPGVTAAPYKATCAACNGARILWSPTP